MVTIIAAFSYLNPHVRDPYAQQRCMQKVPNASLIVASAEFSSTSPEVLVAIAPISQYVRRAPLCIVFPGELCPMAKPIRSQRDTSRTPAGNGIPDATRELGRQGMAASWCSAEIPVDSSASPVTTNTSVGIPTAPHRLVVSTSVTSPNTSIGSSETYR